MCVHLRWSRECYKSGDGMRKHRSAEEEEMSWKTCPGYAVFLWGKATQANARRSRPSTCGHPFCCELCIACLRNYTQQRYKRVLCTSCIPLVNFVANFTSWPYFTSWRHLHRPCNLSTLSSNVCTKSNCYKT